MAPWEPRVFPLSEEEVRLLEVSCWLQVASGLNRSLGRMYRAQVRSERSKIYELGLAEAWKVVEFPTQSRLDTFGPMLTNFTTIIPILLILTSCYQFFPYFFPIFNWLQIGWPRLVKNLNYEAGNGMFKLSLVWAQSRGKCDFPDKLNLGMEKILVQAGFTHTHKYCHLQTAQHICGPISI